jgi:aconitate hydratase
MDAEYGNHPYHFSAEPYKSRVYSGFGKAETEVPLQFGPNITDWPAMPGLTDHLLLKAACFLTDPVTTTDELIPSGETSSYRSNPLRLSEFTLSRKDPAYVGKSKAIQKFEKIREEGGDPAKDNAELAGVLAKAAKASGIALGADAVGIGSMIYAVKPGDGSAREQAASCQKVLGGWANIAREYATKRYRSNLINWGILPFLVGQEPPFANDGYVFIPNIREAVANKTEKIKAYAIGDSVTEFELTLGDLTQDERQILIDGCLINYYRNEK